MNQRSIRDQLLFSIGLAVTRSRDLLRRLPKAHVTDDTRQQLPKRVVEHLEHSGFEIDEPGRAIRKRPPVEPHGRAPDKLLGSRSRSDCR